jgi:DNA invertase Pin-like site-specific DNA recombinase
VCFSTSRIASTLDSPTDKIMLSLTAFADELEREKARQRTYDAMARKARAGHVTGGRTFGYDNVDVPGPAGSCAYVTHQINQAEAVAVRRIFDLAAAGEGAQGYYETAERRKSDLTAATTGASSRPGAQR